MVPVNELINYGLDPIPRYLVLRDIMKLSEDNNLVIEAKEAALHTKWVKDLISIQQSNGSFGYFHSLNYSKGNFITTEQALRRLKILGLDNRDLCIQNTIAYLQRFLEGKEDFPDRKEKLHDWTIFTHLMVAAQIRQFDPYNKVALEIANKWKLIIEYSFCDNFFDKKRYEEVYIETFSKKPSGGRLIDFVNFYPVVLLNGILKKEKEEVIIEYILNKSNGIYYIYDNCIKTLPKSFNSKESSKYLTAIELLSTYNYGKKKLRFVSEWLMNNVSADGFWDMGINVKDGMIYPLSNSWRNKFNRKIDCTVRIMKILTSLKEG